uniref:PhoH-like protein n=1 Tax=Paulinella micropora TaxID=1928728 RepID=A0A385HZD2_9EUKA|nr:PhoH-like phosphate starvation-inducible protein [Paulinella micropora]AXY63017.1 PhoH-like phosphate starvation-inducible protein [Paulinella micropora]
MTEVEPANNSDFTIDLPHQSAALSLTGPCEVIRHQLERLTGASLVLRGLQLIIKGKPDQLERTVALIELLRPLWEEGQSISSIDVQAALGSFGSGLRPDYENFGQKVLAKTQTGRLLKPQTVRQKVYLDAMEANELTLVLGPAGTGKTFLAIVLAVRMLSERKVERIILTRPIEEGYEYSDAHHKKTDPYLLPLYDCLLTLLGPDKTSMMMDKALIEVIPVGYMRGRTLNNTFIILDEAQNTTSTQMRMLVTRLGENSRMVAIGDLTQVELPDDTTSGLAEATEVLKGVECVHIVHLTNADVVRHPLVQKLVELYASYDQSCFPYQGDLP